MFTISNITTFEDEWAKGANLKVDALIRDFMDDVADYGESVLRNEVPVSNKPNRKPGILEHIHRGDVEKHAGGFWTVELGILPIATSDTPDYPRFVHDGTGRSAFNRQSGMLPSGGSFGGRFGSGKRGAIRVAPGNFIAFQKLGEPGNSGSTWRRGSQGGDGWIYTKKHKGIKENKFMSRTERQVSQYIRRNKKELEKQIEAVI